MTNSTSSSELRQQQHEEEEDRDDDMTKKSTIESMLPIRMVSKVVRGFGRGSSDLGIPTANLERSVLRLSTSSSCGRGGDSSKIVLFDNLPCGIYWGFARIGDKSSNVENRNSSTNPNPMGIAYKAAVSIGYNPTYGNGTLLTHMHAAAPRIAPPSRYIAVYFGHFFLNQRFQIFGCPFFSFLSGILFKKKKIAYPAEKTVEPHLIAPASDPRRHASSCGETVLQDFYDQPIRLAVVGYLRPELPFEGLEKLIEAIKKDIRDTETLCDGTGSATVQEKLWVESDEKLL